MSYIKNISLDSLVSDLVAVRSNIRRYIKCEEVCSRCSKKKEKSDMVCGLCDYFTPDIVHLDIMVEHEQKLYEEYVERKRGELCYDGGVIG